MSPAPSTVLFPPGCAICVPWPMFSSSWGWEKGGHRWRKCSRGGEVERRRKRAEGAGNRPPGLSCSASPSEWPLCCTRPGPPTATGLGGRSMHRWRRGRGSPCPWGTPASGQPLCMCWGTSCRALGYWPPLSSSTSRYCARRPTPAFLPQLHTPAPSLHPWPLSPPSSSQLPRTPGSGHGPFPSAELSGASQVLFAQDTPRSSSGGFLFPGLRGLFLYSLSTRQLTPSAPSSSLSVPLDPRLPPSEMFFVSSWKVNPMPLLPT